MLYGFSDLKGPEKEMVQIEFYRSKEEKALVSEKLRRRDLWEKWQLNISRRRKRPNSGHEDRRVGAVFGRLRGIQTELYLEEMGLEAQVCLRYWAKGCGLHL